MKLCELNPGDRFVLNRDQQHYILIRKYLQKGKPTSKCEVMAVQSYAYDERDATTHTLNHQCQVTKINSP